MKSKVVEDKSRELYRVHKGLWLLALQKGGAMKGVRLAQINSAEDLKKCDLEWVLEECSLRVIKGCYADIPRLVDFKPVRRKRVTLLCTMLGRIFTKEYDAVVGKTGGLYIPHDELVKAFDIDFDNL